MAKSNITYCKKKMLAKALLKAHSHYLQVKGEREDRTKTTRYSCKTVVSNVIVNRETRIQTQLDHQSRTRNDILLGVHKKIFASPQMPSAMSQRC